MIQTEIIPLYWKIGEDVSIETVDKYRNPAANKLDAATIYEEGKPKTYIVSHAKWLEVKKAMDEAGQLKPRNSL